MTRPYYSPFQPAKIYAESGTKPVAPYQFIEAIDGDASRLSEQAEEVHTWLKQQAGPVEKLEVVKTFGTKNYNEMREMHTYSLEAFPVEELVHHGLARVVKGAR